MQQTVKFLQRDMFRLRYVIEGEGDPILVIGDSHYYPQVFSAELKQRFSFIYLDHRGFVPMLEQVTQADYELDVILDDMEALRVELGLSNFWVLGHSGHAFMALEYAKKYPTCCKGVVITGMAPSLSAANKQLADAYWDATASDERKAQLAANLQAVTDADLDAMSPSDRFIADYCRKAPQIWYDYHFDAKPLFANSTFNIEIFSYIWGKVFAEIDITKNIENFTVPVLVAIGKNDYLVAPPSSWQDIIPQFANMTLTIFDKSGHTPSYEESAAFDAKLLAWTASVSKALAV